MPTNIKIAQMVYMKLFTPQEQFLIMPFNWTEWLQQGETILTSAFGQSHHLDIEQ